MVVSTSKFFDAISGYLVAAHRYPNKYLGHSDRIDKKGKRERST